ncbi:MAG: ABC transporter permease [Muribaculaceae bacterium]|nr:ABC transporter permease [Muribaculaceae bacterium]
MNYSFFLARRISLGSKGAGLSPAVKVAMAAVAISVAVMIAALAIVQGFKREILSKLSGFNADLIVTPVSDQDSSNGNNSFLINYSPSLRQLISSRPYVEDVALNVAAPAILKTPEDFKGVYLKSLVGENLISLLASSIEEGSLPAFINTEESAPDSAYNQILVSRVAASKLGLHAGQKIDVYFITDQVRVRRLKISGIFNSHFDTYDNIYIFGSPRILGEIGSVQENQATSLGIKIAEDMDMDEAAADLQNVLLEALSNGYIYTPYRVESLRASSGNFFQWLELLDMNVVIIIVLMTFVACVTLVSGMLIIIVDKKKFIALMRALGMPGRNIRRIFIYLALRVSVTGLIIGDAVGLGIMWLQHTYHFIPLDADAYYIDFVPVEFSWPEILALNVGVLFVTYLVLILPARFIGSISPAKEMATA